MCAAISNVAIGESTYGLRRLPYLGDSLVRVFLPDEVRSLREELRWQTERGRSAKTLVKSGLCW